MRLTADCRLRTVDCFRHLLYKVGNFDGEVCFFFQQVMNKKKKLGPVYNQNVLICVSGAASHYVKSVVYTVWAIESSGKRYNPSLKERNYIRCSVQGEGKTISRSHTDFF